MKRCSTCRHYKSESEFYKNKSNRDGLTSQCKLCARLSVKKYQDSEHGQIKKEKYSNFYRKTSKGKEVHAKAKRRYTRTPNGQKSVRHYRQSEKGIAAKDKYIENNPEKRKAMSAIRKAVRKGIIPNISNQICHDCRSNAQEYHHYLGYAPEHWLDVIPLCRICHKSAHKVED